EPTKDLGQAYAHGAIGTAIPMAGHAVLGAAFREASNITAKRANDPILSRLADPNDVQGTVGYKQRLSDLYTAVKDDLNPIKKAEQYLTDGTPLPPELSAYVAAQLTRGAAGKADHFVEYGTFDAKTGQKNGPSLA